jgi:putative PEP-CTERM system histidine kinase
MTTTLATAIGATATALSAGLAAATLWRSRHSLAHRALFAGLLAIAVEGVLAMAAADATSTADAVAWERWRVFATSALPGAWLVFALTFGRRDPRRFLRGRPWVWALAGLPLVLGGPLGAFTFSSAVRSEGAWRLSLDLVGMLLHVCVLVGLAFVLIELERTFRASSGAIRWQIKFVVLGLAVLFATRIYSVSQALLFRSVDTSLHVLDAIGVAFGLMIVALGVARTRLLDFDVYLSPTALYRSIAALLIATYLLVVGVLAQVLREFGSGHGMPLAAFLVLLALVGLAVPAFSDNFRRSTRRFISRNLRRPHYDYRREWMAFTDRTTSVLDLNALCAAVARVVSETVGTPSVSVWLSNDPKGSPVLGGSTAFTAEQGRALVAGDPDAEALFRALLAREEPLDLQGAGLPIPGRAEAGLLSEARYSVALAAGGERLGIMTLSERGGGYALTDEDLDLVRTLAKQAAAAASNLRLTTRLMKAREMETFQHLSAFFIHDLKNLASRLSLTMQNAPRHLDDPEFRRDMLSTVSLTVAEIEQTCSRLWPLSGRLELRRRPADLNAVVGATLQELNGAIGAVVKKDLAPLPATAIDPDQIQKVLVNLVLNANDAAGTDGEIRVSTAERDGCVLITVADNGCGMPREFVERSLFEPFSTTKRNGLGIGLFHSRKIVEAHQGRIEVETSEGAGSTFRVVLPAGASS